MKRSKLLLWLCFAVIISDSLGQLTLTDPLVSKAGEYSLDTTKSKGQLLTLSTENSFSWVIPDQLKVNEEFYATLQCVTSGSVVDFGFTKYDKAGYPASYSRDSVIMPLVGGNFPTGTISDVISFYYPSKPVRAAAHNFDLPLVSTAGDKYYWANTSPTVDVSVTPFTTPPKSIYHDGISFSIGFEILNCGTATWCIQTKSQFESSPGVCDPGNTQTCQAPSTCTASTSLSDCSTDSKFIIDNSLCLNKCPDEKFASSVGTNLFVCKGCTSPCSKCSETTTKCTSCIANNYLYKSSCSTSCPAGTFKVDATMTCDDCTSPCAECSESATTCTSCIADHYLYQDTCVSECPSGYTADSSSRKCKIVIKSESQGIAGWKLGVAIGVPVFGVTSGIIIFILLKLKAKAASMAAAAKGKAISFQQIVSNPTSPTAETQI